MRRFAIWGFLLLCFSAQSYATGYVYDYNDNCSQAYLNILSMHFTEGRVLLGNESKVNPHNLMPVYLADYEDCITLLLNCDKKEYDNREDQMDKRLEQLEKGDHNSPWYRFCKSGVYLHWALINLRFGDYYHQAVYFRKSFVLLKENKKLFPSFEYNNIFSGLQEAVAGSLPSNYKWLAALFGISGDVRKGTNQLGSFIAAHNSAQPLYSETVLYYLFTRFYLVSEQKEVWDYLSSPQFLTHNNLLNTFVKVSLSLDYRKADTAIKVLQAAGAEPDYAAYPVFDYLMGIALYTRADTACVPYFQRYLKGNKSDIFIKDAWAKMALAWYMAGNKVQAASCRRQIKAQGSARLDADKLAQKFGTSENWPNKKLLQSRLLIEGGYYRTADALLRTIDLKLLTDPGDRAEYFFRFGRVFEELNDNNNALLYYQYTITTGKDRHEQFAARAALQKGRIYEKTAKYPLAIACYKECLDMPAHDFQNSIDNQAKAGLNRVGFK